MAHRQHSDEHGSEPDNHFSDMQARVKALETLLVEKGLIDPASIDAIIDTYETKVGPHVGAAIVAKAWSDGSFADQLHRDANAALRKLGVGEQQGERMRAVFNTAHTHNIVVCTLCSCYPWSVLGLPPVWYKSAAYRSRVVIDPRGVLAEFGLVLPESKQLRVWDSTAELRYIVVPERPPGTEHMNEAELAALVTRDTMIGTAIVRNPGASS
jgi:nitrile hydratase subunit alpha